MSSRPPKKILELPTANTVSANDYLVIARGSGTFKTPITNINGSDSSIPTIQTLENDYELNLDDFGKIILLNDGSYTLNIPRDEEIEFPVGFMITIITRNYSCYVYPKEYEDENPITEIMFVDGNSGSSTGAWEVGGRTIATLAKVDSDFWYLSGPSIQED